VELDRVTPTRRPDAEPSGTQSWRELLFLHWSIPVAEMRRVVPEPLVLDTWDGRAWVGLVPFLMKDVRTSWMPRGTGLDFHETNLRTYVHHDGVPGVYFFSLEASSWLAVRAARLGWSLPYFHADMSSSRQEGRFSYRSVRRESPAANLHVAWALGDLLGPSAPDTFEHFLLERYVLYSFSRRKTLLRGHVHHPPYPAQRASVTTLEQGLVLAAGLTLSPGVPPSVVHYAEGVDVEVFGPWEI
jgi:uncharacterized protein YqjF (DUF2071 family)